MTWHLHWLEASGDLAPWREKIATEIEGARTALSQLLPPPSLDVLIQRLPNVVIPQIGMVGRAYRKNLFSLTLDPDNRNFERCLHDGTLRRQVIHEVHHCLRMGAVGYGRTLGEALVSEGLAGRFVSHLFGTPPEPWECAVDDATLRKQRPEDADLVASPYDHKGWFFGGGGLRPYWYGYSLGYRLVGDWLVTVPEPTASLWVDVSADSVLAAGRRGILSSRPDQ